MLPAIRSVCACWHCRWSIGRSRRGVAALEFAICAPVLIVLLLGVYDLARGWTASSKLTTSAFSIGQIATILAVQSDGTSVLNGADAWRAATAINGSMPQTLAPGSSYAVSFSEVEFSTDNTCTMPTYCIAKVKWTVNMLPGNNTTYERKCVQLNRDADTVPPDLGDLPLDAFTASPILVVDVYYTYTPTFTQSIISPITMHWMAPYGARSGNLQSRSDQFIHYVDAPNPAGALVTQCP